MYIKKLELKNFKAIEEFEREFEGNVYLVTGENEIGKSTLLNAITTLLTGDRSSNLLKQGKEKGFARATVSDKDSEYEVELRFSEANPRGTLTIKREDGMKSDNKTMIQKIFNYNAFDANEFIGWSNSAEGKRKQVNIVKSLLDADVVKRLQEIETEVEETKESRKEVNAKHKANTSILDKSAITPDDVKKFSEKKSIKDLYDKRDKANTANNEILDVETRKGERKKVIDKFDEQTIESSQGNETLIDEKKEELKILEDTLVQYKSKRVNELKDLNDKQIKASEWLEKNKRKDVSEIDLEIEESEKHNEKNLSVKEYVTVADELVKLETSRSTHNGKIVKLEDEKTKLMKNSSLPVKGLTFTEQGLFLNEIPFSHGEVSSSQEMEVAVKLIIAMNPTVKVFKIAQGESLGAKKMKDIIDFAKKNNYQGFIEQMQRGQDELIINEYTESQ